MPKNRDASKTPSDAWIAPDDPSEWTDAMFERADLWVGGSLIRSGRVTEAPTKVTVGLRLSADVVARFRASGRGWHARLDAALRDWLSSHPDFG